MMADYFLIGIVIILGIIHFLLKKDAADEEHNTDYGEWFNEMQKPHVEFCQHKGEKTLVNQPTTSVNCEQVNLICDDCGAVVKYGEIDCR